MIVLPSSEPCFDLRCFMSGVVVHDNMDVEPFSDLSVDLFEKFQELNRSVTLITFADDEPRGNIECSKQRCRAMPHITVRAPFRYTRHHWQDRLLAIECLYLALLID